MREKPSASGLQKVHFNPGRRNVTLSRRAPVQQECLSHIEDAEVTTNWGQRPTILCCKRCVQFKLFNCQPYGSKDGFITSEGNTPFDGLGQFIDAKKVLTSDPWMPQAVRGFRIPFASSSSQNTWSTEPVFLPEQAGRNSNHLWRREL